MSSTVMSTRMVSARGGSAAVQVVATRAKATAMGVKVAFAGGASVQSVGGGRRAVMWRRGGREQQRSLVVRAADDEEVQQPISQTRKRAPKPLPSTFGEGKVTGKKTLPFQDPFESKTGGNTPVASPFDMPASSAGDAGDAAPATPAASPFGAAAPSAGGAAKPASPFGASAPPAAATAATKQPASPFGAAAAAKPGSPFGATAAPPSGGSPFANTGAFGAAPKAAGGSPFAQSGSAANPFGDAAAGAGKKAKAPQEEKVDERSAWEKIPKPAMAQVVIVLSFTTIITLMLATFWVVVQLGGVSFNDS